MLYSYQTKLDKSRVSKLDYTLNDIITYIVMGMINYGTMLLLIVQTFRLHNVRILSLPAVSVIVLLSMMTWMIRIELDFNTFAAPILLIFTSVSFSLISGVGLIWSFVVCIYGFVVTSFMQLISVFGLYCFDLVDLEQLDPISQSANLSVLISTLLTLVVIKLLERYRIGVTFVTRRRTTSPTLKGINLSILLTVIASVVVLAFVARIPYTPVLAIIIISNTALLLYLLFKKELQTV